MSTIDRLFNQTPLKRLFGNITTTATNDVLVSSRAYTELSNERQCSVKSTSATDSDGAGTGARIVRIDYLDSSYVLKSTDVALNGTTQVDTTPSDIRFIQNFYVVKGTAAVGALQLMDGPSGGPADAEFCGISSGTTQAFLAHYYVPAGKQVWVVHWGATTTREANLKLMSQDRLDGTNLVDRNIDLENIRNNALTNDQSMDFGRDLGAVLIPEKTRIRIHVVPSATTSTVTRAWFYVWEETL